ncbi:3-ketoacyl-CoA thiolase with broad chain length specificity [Desmophyllum pertusum]|uniref:Protection of telomeres protein 1 n=1 Tax=Desmophyllum pertusum TaxID=174260 RepID=A0A9W9YCF8_9CNID|nr:3-ketoacyl-CoA thiolase with broad chain length specificity [Desmophyllum pertusum]
MQMSTVPSDLPQLMAPRAGSSSTVENNNVAGSGNGQNNKEHSNMKKGNPPKTPSENSIMPDFEQEEHVFVSARRLSSSSDTNRRSPAKGLRQVLLASQDSSEKGSAKRGSPLQQVPDPKRLRTSPGPSHRSPSPDRSGSTFSGRVRKRSSRAPEDYTVPPGYTTLGNLQPETTVNVYGVVKSFKPAWKCRGTDMCCVLMLMDPTIAESSSGLEVVSFQSSVTRLPAVHKIGDIVRLHRVKVSQYQGRLQATSTRGFAAIVFDRDTELPVTVEMARNSSSTFTLLQSDKDTVESLKNWSDAHPVLFTPSNFLSVSLINPDSYFDLTCQVLGVALHRTLDCVVLYVTDGTQPNTTFASVLARNTTWSNLSAIAQAKTMM